ncbi:methylated-DNA--[protein]-cysteine S-methyltransferase [Solirubrobacter phytolaccae]|uniref:Methylated-DNA--protein-cysteine methyltransferase n=1 Tax=Solirubrobacter phytolaccae TaxID=1404360 RepID=A0A9X3SFI0_9ACTN|nr:methylated-DNA--[protein]-cysteine S-methyltransferase [Solirubrobacter phytolaccae]MDA0181547.1 methylated-DNA--[protein]-cysteine S-methyltransferase [Solirubrobacter phytolaccae]
MHTALLQSPIGPLHVTVDEGGLTALYTAEHRLYAATEAPRDETFGAVREQLDEYFAGTRQTFELPLHERGTPFERAVWARLRTIPFGETATYGEIARELGSAPRAVGRANGRNAISIIVPCHRVVGTNGSLTGYAGGLPTKQQLLRHESLFAGRLSEPPGVAF